MSEQGPAIAVEQLADARLPRLGHPLTGRRAPNLELADGTDLFTALRPGRYVRLGFAGTPAPTPGVITRAASRPGTRPAWSTVHAALIRPDGHVAWAADDPDRDPGVITSP
ncbi:hypothetical protein [Streptomyces sp. JH34]|uniref:aromatic-ring hydroxylase C-terminal domain-containing protein n=1 Tax=Streptomyces sp. JH34 TaxID=2793633 RepID=UPI0023F968A7|nr:hypothetical protein [Streptomyces sp. JH34]MDF6020429.1 hypothetical protein [Streptomyces sp. JH34]